MPNYSLAPRDVAVLLRNATGLEDKAQKVWNSACVAFEGFLDRIGDVIVSLPIPDSICPPPPDGGPPSPAQPPPLDVQQTLFNIAAAINEAEKTLNLQNLIIGSGSIETVLDVAIEVGGKLLGAGAHTTIKINLGPKPYS